MARRIVWANRALADRKAIFQYWNKRNQSKVYSRKLNGLLNMAAEILSKFPETGRKTTRENVRAKFVSNFAIIYEIALDHLAILAIFDTRQNPTKFKDILDKK